MKNTSITIVGAGPVGSIFALRLAQHGIPVTLLDKRHAQDVMVTEFDRRAYALSHGTVTFLKKITHQNTALWEEICTHAEPIEHIWVAEERTQKSLILKNISATSSSYHTKQASPMGYIVESQYVLRALYKVLAQQKNIAWHQNVSVKKVTQNPYATTTFFGEKKVHSALVVAADGRFSSLAQQTKIPIRRWDYQRTAIVCPLRHTLPHKNWAFEIFTSHGPLALLPMKGETCSSLVWSVPQLYASFLLKQSDQIFTQLLHARFGQKLGTFQCHGKRWSYPLSGVMMKTFTQGRMAFLGDATCGIHPVAGQGLNLGLQGCKTLSDLIIKACHHGLDPGHKNILDQYNMHHRPKAAIMALGSHVLVKCFESRSAFIRKTMGYGLGIVERMPFVKQRLVNYAMGETFK